MHIPPQSSSCSVTQAELAGSPNITGVPLWNAELDDTLICRQVRNETHDVKTFAFSAIEPRLFQFRAGQFLTWEFEIEGKRVNRCYTIASSPARPHLVSITTKRVPGGELSPWMHDNMRPGMAVRAIGPMGDFTCAGHTARKYLFLSGGSGITPLMSMARCYDDLASEAEIVFVHNACSPGDIIFRTELEELARHRPGFRFVPVCEGDAPGLPWHGLRGRLSLPMLRLIAPDLASREIFTCGPAPYMAAVRAMLGEIGFPMAHYHEESFDFATLNADAVSASLPADDVVPAAGFNVLFSKSGRTIVCNPDRTILESALAAGLRLPSSCTKGMCGTCKSHMESGEVEMNHQGGIRKREIDQGMILLCCSRPKADLVIDR
jgi:glycine betaine catabolism B